MEPFIVTGAPVSGEAPCRLEINDFVKDVKMFSLYVQALAKMQADDQEYLTSHFQVGGIHGMPYIPWNGVGAQQEGTWGGYCTHRTNLFPTWHRPYVALFEQILQAHAVTIAEKYTIDPLGWKDAADNLRQPYWDWAKNSVPPEEIISLQRVRVVLPNGPASGTYVDNPFFGYRFHPAPDPSFLPPYNTWPQTVRHPTTEDPSVESDVESLKSTLKGEQQCLRDKTFNLLICVHEWPLFSNASVKQEVTMLNSLEAIHDSIHVQVGGAAPGKCTRGHMANTDVAGFDPIFFLHHAQVDRLMSLWQAINFDVWVTPGSSGEGKAGGTWTVPDNTILDTNTDLTPFRESSENFWTSAQIQSTITMGYNYPEFKGLDMNDPEAVRTHIVNYVERTYGYTIDHPVFRAISGAVYEDLPDDTRKRAASGIWEWIVRVRVKQFAAGGSFSVLFFLGTVPEDPLAWITSSSFVGSYDVFANGARERCSNCMNNEDMVVEGTVHLEQPIASRSGLTSFDPEFVEPYLKANIGWRVLIGGKAVSADEIPSLEVRVVGTRVTLQPGTRFPDFGKPTIFEGITDGLPGGSLGQGSSD